MPKKKTYEEFKKNIYDLVGDEYTLLSEEYINNKTKVEIFHNICNHKYKVTPSDFLQGKRCPYCANVKRNINKRISPEEYDKIVSNKLSDYTIIEGYKNSRTKLTIKHNLCNRVFKMYPENFKKQNCPYCFGTPKKTHNKFVEEVFNITNNEYEVLGKYTTNKNKIKIKHKKCGFIYEVAPYHFLQGKRCPKCRESKGEKKISDWFNKNGYEYETQFKFPDCKNVKELPFDFKLETDDGIIVLIEYDGIQHEKGYFVYNEDELNKQKIRDKIKDDYCKLHENIDLYRISYKDYDNIEIILENIVNKYE